MALRLLAQTVLKKRLSLAPLGAAQCHSATKIGNREVVGYGWNGSPTYADRLDYPLPPIRFKEVTPEIKALREKEKDHWKKLTLDEKKALYRASFCQTLSELNAPSGEWKVVTGGIFIISSLALLVSLWMNLYVYPEMPETFDEAHQKAQLKRILDLEMNPVRGLSSTWDYEGKKWK